VVSSSLRPSGTGESVVEAVVENTGGGEGEVLVEATLRSESAMVDRVDQAVTLRAHERIYEALLARDRTGARDAMIDHLDDVRSALDRALEQGI
jgi:DNA-binding GntR family transcriptional regulator